MVRLPNKKYGVAVLVAELNVVHEERARLLQQVLDVVVLLPDLGFALCFLFLLVVLFEGHLEVPVVAQHLGETSKPGRRFRRK